MTADPTRPGLGAGMRHTKPGVVGHGSHPSGRPSRSRSNARALGWQPLAGTGFVIAQTGFVKA